MIIYYIKIRYFAKHSGSYIEGNALSLSIKSIVFHDILVSDVTAIYYTFSIALIFLSSRQCYQISLFLYKFCGAVSNILKCQFLSGNWILNKQGINKHVFSILKLMDIYPLLLCRTIEAVFYSHAIVEYCCSSYTALINGITKIVLNVVVCILLKINQRKCYL